MVYNPDAPTLEQHGEQLAKRNGRREILNLEREIAEDCAKSDIECHCLWEEVDGVRWYDTAEEEGDLLAKSVRYLELRGLIERHPTNRKLVRLL